MRKALYIVNYPIYFSGGVLYSSVDFAKGVLGVVKGFEVKFLCVSEVRFNPNYVQVSVSVDRVDVIRRDHGYFSELLKILSSSLLLAQKIRGSNLVLVKFFQVSGLVAFICARFFSKKTFVLMVGDPGESLLMRNDLISSDALRTFVSNCLRRFIVIMVSSATYASFVSNVLKEKYGNAHLQAAVGSESWLDDIDFSKKLISKDSLLKGEISILYVGRVVREKGIFELIRAVSYLSNNGCQVKLCIVGDGKDRMAAVELTKNLGLLKRVEFSGYIMARSDKLREKYNSANVFILPSYSEGLPLCLLEAFAAKCIVIASNVGGVSEIVKNEETGYLLREITSEEIAQKISWIINRPHEAIKVIDAAYELAKTKKFWGEQEKIYHYVSVAANG